MSEVSLTVNQLGPVHYQVSVAAPVPDTLYYAYRDALLMSGSTAAEWSISLTEEAVVQIQVFDDIADVPDPAYPGFVTLYWQAVSGATHYRIDLFEAAEWVQKGFMGAQGLYFFKWRSGQLTDNTEYRFRVVPIINGVDGTPREFRRTIFRTPPAPVVDSETFDAVSGVLTLGVH